MTAITFRDADPAAPADVAQLAAIGAQTFTETFGHLYSPADHAAFLANDHSPAAVAALLAKPHAAARLAFDGDDVAGYAVVAPNALPHVPDDLATLELKRLYLLKRWHGRGLADPLIAWAEDHARATGHAATSLSVFSDNARGKAFYRRHGYVHMGDYHFMVGAQADLEHVWCKRL